LSNIIEQDDQIEIDGQIFHKPFVEKPVSAENHDVYIYFPSSAGGGSQRLFRKVQIIKDIIIKFNINSF
jgi:inositol hexakisphosphate/diphosphoinositol-pentakisphosphate kinase